MFLFSGPGSKHGSPNCETFHLEADWWPHSSLPTAVKERLPILFEVFRHDIRWNLRWHTHTLLLLTLPSTHEKDWRTLFRNFKSTGETINKILLFVSFTPKKPAVLLQIHVIELLILQTSVFNLSCKGQSALHTFFQVLIIYKRLRFETRQQALSSHEKVLFPVTRVQFSIWCRRWH